jgi:hypothetical protein
MVRYGFKNRSVQRAGTPALPTGRNRMVTLFLNNDILMRHAMESTKFCYQFFMKFYVFHGQVLSF